MKGKRLNLGCGKDIKKGYINLDIVKMPGVDIVYDINKKLPFPKEHFELIKAKDILEHVDDLSRVMKELHRTLKPEGKLLIEVPHYNSPSAYTDPTHKYFFSSQTFFYFQKKNPQNYYFDFGFEEVYVKLTFLKKIYFLYNYLLEFITNINNNTRMLYENTPLKMFPSHILKIKMIR